MMYLMILEGVPLIKTSPRTNFCEQEIKWLPFKLQSGEQGRLDCYMYSFNKLFCSITLSTQGKPLKLLECMVIQTGNHMPDGLFQGNSSGKGRIC